MFVPLHDNNALRVIRFQYVTSILIVVNVLVFLWTQYFSGGIGLHTIAASLGIVPVDMKAITLQPLSLAEIPEPLRLITYTFIHGGWLHLIANMAFMWVFADNIEDAYGHVGFLLFYIVCGIIAAGAHIVANPDSAVPLVGASGSVSGILGAYLVLFPRARVWVLFLKLPIPLPISALWALIGWIGFQFLQLYWQAGEQEIIVAWWAHIGGFAAGFLITALFRNTLIARLS